MKKNTIKQLIMAAVALFGTTACQQGEWLEGIVDVVKPTEDKLVSRSYTCEVTVANAGELSTALAAKAQADGFTIDQITSLTITGPIKTEDIDCIRESTNIETLDLTNCKFVELAHYWFNGDEVYEEREAATIPDKMFANFASNAEIKLPVHIKSINSEAFSQAAITSIVIPDSVTNIGWKAFNQCENLATVKMPNQLTHLSSSAFESCKALKEIELPTSLTAIGSHCFGETGLRQIVIPDAVEAVESGAFADCTELESVVWPSNVHEIKSWTFRLCSKLKFAIPDHITRIENAALFGCEGITELTIPESLNFLGWAALGSTSISSLQIPANVELEGATFQYCKKLTTVKLPDGLEVIQDQMFQDCENLEEVVMPNTVHKIGTYAFTRCKSLKDLTLSNALDTIGYYAFGQCSSLEKFEMPTTMKFIDEQAFQECKALGALALPEGLEQIGKYAFNGSSITELTIPSTVQQCGAFIVSGCDNLRVVYWNANIAVGQLVEYNWQNRSFILYVKEDVQVNPNNVNVVKAGVAESFVLSDDKPFYCPQSFTAKTVTYTKNYNWMQTFPGESCGWRTIVLPFTATKIVQKRDEGDKLIAPFNSGVEGAKPFWLRELTAEGFKDATQIEANKPYIVAFPNNWDYLEDYRITGTIEFSATDATILASNEAVPVVGPDFTLVPTFETVPQSDSVWMLNDSDWTSPSDGNNYRPGGVFLVNLRDVRPFECYVTNTASRSYIPVAGKAASTRAARQAGPIPSITDM